MKDAGVKRKVRDVVVGPLAAIVATLAVFASVGGLLTLLEPRSDSAIAVTTSGSGSVAPSDAAPSNGAPSEGAPSDAAPDRHGAAGRYGSGTLAPWEDLNRRISSEDQIREVLAFNGLFMFGDSLSVQDSAALERMLAARTGDSIAEHNWSGQPTSAAVDALANWSQDYGLPDRILMATGTNDIFDPPAFAAQVERAMAIAGPNRTVYWVNVEVSRFKRPAGTQAADRTNSAWINQQLESAAMRHSNLRIVHWSEFLNTQPAGYQKYLRDGVHTTTPVGAAARNDLIADAIQAASKP
ncbi:hypothetical protein [Kribbella sp. NPDC055071]